MTMGLGISRSGDEFCFVPKSCGTLRESSGLPKLHFAVPKIYTDGPLEVLCKIKYAMAGTVVTWVKSSLTLTSNMGVGLTSNCISSSPAHYYCTWETSRGWSRAWAPSTRTGDPECHASDFGLTQPNHCRHLGSEPVEGRPFSFHFFLCVTLPLKKQNKSEKKNMDICYMSNTLE